MLFIASSRKSKESMECRKWTAVMITQWADVLQRRGFFFFEIPFLFAICTSTFSKLCKNMYTVACRRVLTTIPL
jgi:hypothetical protein